MKSNLLYSGILHILFFGTIFLTRPTGDKFEGYPTVIPIEIVEVEPVSFKAPEVQKIVPRQEPPKPQPKELEGVTLEKKEIVEEEPEEERPIVQEEEPEKSDEGKSAEEGEDIELDVKVFPFSYYKAIIRSRLETNWEPPVSGRKTLVKSTLVTFRIQRSGRITDIRLVEGSGDYLYDQSCLRAVTLANPLPPLPFDFPKQSLGVNFAFKQGN